MAALLQKQLFTQIPETLLAPEGGQGAVQPGLAHQGQVAGTPVLEEGGLLVRVETPGRLPPIFFASSGPITITRSKFIATPGRKPR